MAGRYAELYRNARAALEIEAETRLGRPLQAHERNLFRNCGTLTRLEEFGMAIFYAQDADELASRLASMSFESRFQLELDETVPRLAVLLGRTLTPAEREQLRSLGNIEALWNVEQQLSAIAPGERSSRWQHILPG